MVIFNSYFDITRGYIDFSCFFFAAFKDEELERKNEEIPPRVATGWWTGISAPARRPATLYSEFVLGYDML